MGGNLLGVGVNLAVKLFATYAIASMAAGLLYAFGFMSGIIPFKPEIFIILWLGPLMMAVIIAAPIGLYKLWNGK